MYSWSCFNWWYVLQNSLQAGCNHVVLLNQRTGTIFSHYFGINHVLLLEPPIPLHFHAYFRAVVEWAEFFGCFHSWVFYYLHIISCVWKLVDIVGI